MKVRIIVVNKDKHGEDCAVYEYSGTLIKVEVEEEPDKED